MGIWEKLTGEKDNHWKNYRPDTGKNGTRPDTSPGQKPPRPTRMEDFKPGPQPDTHKNGVQAVGQVKPYPPPPMPMTINKEYMTEEEEINIINKLIDIDTTKIDIQKHTKPENNLTTIIQLLTQIEKNTRPKSYRGH